MQHAQGIPQMHHSGLLSRNVLRHEPAVQISIVLEYMDSGSLADLVKQVCTISEPS